jgi:hypothetical protein
MTTAMWIWLVVGCVPYQASRVWSPPGTLSLSITAIFWWVQIERHVGGRYNWNVRVPLISRMKAAVWAAVTRLRSDMPFDEAEDDADRRTKEKEAE